MTSIASTLPWRAHRDGAEVALGSAIETPLDQGEVHPLTVAAIHLHADPVVIDEQNPNASTMAYYFQDSSIAALRKVGEGHYLTSTGLRRVFRSAQRRSNEGRW